MNEKEKTKLWNDAYECGVSQALKLRGEKDVKRKKCC